MCSSNSQKGTSVSALASFPVSLLCQPWKRESGAHCLRMRKFLHKRNRRATCINTKFAHMHRQCVPGSLFHHPPWKGEERLGRGYVYICMCDPPTRLIVTWYAWSLELRAHACKLDTPYACYVQSAWIREGTFQFYGSYTYTVFFRITDVMITSVVVIIPMDEHMMTTASMAADTGAE